MFSDRLMNRYIQLLHPCLVQVWMIYLTHSTNCKFGKVVAATLLMLLFDCVTSSTVCFTAERALMKLFLDFEGQLH